MELLAVGLEGRDGETRDLEGVVVVPLLALLAHQRRDILQALVNRQGDDLAVSLLVGVEVVFAGEAAPRALGALVELDAVVVAGRARAGEVGSEDGVAVQALGTLGFGFEGEAVGHGDDIAQLVGIEQRVALALQTHGLAVHRAVIQHLLQFDTLVVLQVVGRLAGLAQRRGLVDRAVGDAGANVLAVLGDDLHRAEVPLPQHRAVGAGHVARGPRHRSHVQEE